MSTPDEDRNRLLSPEEIEALANDDYDADEDNAAALAEIGRGTMDADEDDEGGDSAADAGAEKTDAAPTDLAPGSDSAPAAEPAPSTSAPAPATPSGYKVDLPADYDDQVKANKDALTDLRKKFDDGEVDAAEYHSKLDELQDQRYDLRELKTRATVAAEMSEQSAKDAWVTTINSFVADAGSKAEMGIVDYATDLGKQADLDTFVKALANTKGNENKPQRWFLEEAHKRVVALHSIPTTKKAADPKRKPDASDVVQSLADVPGGAGDADPLGDEFSELDKLTGMDYERELARMPQEKRDRYLMAN